MTHTMTIRPAWTPFTVFLMVIGFLVAWPLGLLMLAYILWGDQIPEFKRNATAFRYNNGFHGQGSSSASGNVAFDEYRRQEMKRLDEERRRLEQERRDFETYAANLRRAKDQEEFNRFMSERRNSADADSEL
jgi:hypothetical protein